MLANEINCLKKRDKYGQWSAAASQYLLTLFHSIFCLSHFNPVVKRHPTVRATVLRNPNAPPTSDAACVLLADRCAALRRWGHRSDQCWAANRLARAAFRSDKRRHIYRRKGDRLGQGSIWRPARGVVGGKKSAANVPVSRITRGDELVLCECSLSCRC